MPQMPKRVKFRKTQRGRVRGNASRGNTVSFGEFGLQSLEGGWLSAEALEAGAKGIKIQLAGRLGGSEMARREKQISGSIPLSTLRAKIDYGFTEAMTAQGHIGVQVWINQGMYGEEPDGADAQASQAPKKPKRAFKR